VEKIRTIDELSLEELEAQSLDLLPEREEMTFNFNTLQVNLAQQLANAQADHGSIAAAANSASQNNYNG
jgi:hypothetical protein